MSVSLKYKVILKDDVTIEIYRDRVIELYLDKFVTGRMIYNDNKKIYINIDEISIIEEL